MSENWRVWDQNQAYGDMFYRRSIGELDEMESSKSAADLIKTVYKPGDKILDVGCGAGHYLKSLRTRLDENVSYTGVDATQYYIELARKAFPDSAEFVTGDILNLPFSDSSYEIVMCNNVLVHLPPPPARAISELLRVAGRHVLIRTAISSRNYIIKELLDHNDNNSAIPKGMSDVDLVTVEEDLKYFNYFNMYTEDYFRSLISTLDDSLQFQCIAEDSEVTFDNTGLTTRTGTQTTNGVQVSGNLLLDWRYLLITKTL